MSEHKEPIPSMIYNAAVGGHVTNSQQIIDENLNKEQSQINNEQIQINNEQSQTNETFLNFINSKGQINGIASLNNSGKVPTSQLPSYVDDVIEGYYYDEQFYLDSDHTQLITPESGKVYIDLSTEQQYRWGGSVYVPLGSLDAVNEEKERAMAAEATLRVQKQDLLTFDSSPTANSNNPVKSSGIKSSLDSLYTVYTGLTQANIIVGSLPSSGIANRIYRVPGSSSYSDYMWNGSSFVKIAESGVDYASFTTIKETVSDWKDTDFFLPGFVGTDGKNTQTSASWRIAIIKVNAGDLIQHTGNMGDPFRCGYTNNLPSSGFTLDYILPTDTPNTFVSPRSGYLCISGHGNPVVQAKSAYKIIPSGMPHLSLDYHSCNCYVNESGVIQGEDFNSRYYPVKAGKHYIISYTSLQDAYNNRGGDYLIGFAYARYNRAPQEGDTTFYWLDMYKENITSYELRAIADGYILINGGYLGGMFPYVNVFEVTSIWDFEANISISLYNNKTCLYIGDSISTGNNYFWKGFLEDNYKLNYVRDIGSNLPAADGGITIMPAEQEEEDNPTIWYRCAQNRMSVYTFDIISLFGGTNDLTNRNLEIGEITDIPFVDDASSITSETVTDVRPETLTFASALMGCILMLKRDFPDKEIVIPTVLYYGGNYGGWTYKNTGLPASEVMAILQMKVAQKYGLKGIPLYWDMKNPNNVMVFSSDSVHPNAQGARRIQAVFAQTLCLK